MPSSAGHYPPGQQQQQQQQQQFVIQKWALVRPDTLQDLLACQRGTSSVHHGGGTNQEDKDCHHLPIVAAGLGGPLCPRQTATRPPRGGPSGTSAAQLQSPGWEAAPTGRRLGSAANGEKTATTGPPSGTRLDPSPEQPQGISRACTVAPESGIMPGTQWPTAMHWSTPWPSTNHACNKSWAWPGWRAAVSTEDVAWRSWGWFPLGPWLCRGSWQTLALSGGDTAPWS